MKRTVIVILLSTLVAASAGIGAYFYLDGKAVETARQAACVATVVPMVSLHHNQNEIVSLLEELASEEESPNKAPVNTAPVATSYVFTKTIDEKLMTIAKMYREQQSGQTVNHETLNKHLETTVDAFQAEAPEFMRRCNHLLVEMEQECGPLEAELPDQTGCREKYNEKLQTIISETAQI